MEHCSNPPAFTGVRARKLVQITTIQSIHQFPHVQNQFLPSFYLFRNPFHSDIRHNGESQLVFHADFKSQGAFSVHFTFLT